MKQIIILFGLVVLGIAIYAIIQGGVLTAITSFIIRGTTKINGTMTIVVMNFLGVKI